MKTIFSVNCDSTITEANVNFYSSPFRHPSRTMKDHDFIYMIDGQWKFGQNDEIFEMQKDSLLILSANQKHFGISHCRANTKTMYFHVNCPEVNAIHPNAENGVFSLDSYFDASNNKNIKKLFSEIINAKILKNQIKANLYFKLLITELHDHVTNSVIDNTSNYIKKIIHDNPEKFYSNEELAKAVSASKKVAEIKFKEAYGVSIHKYTLEFKIKEAISYFNIFPEMPIKEVAINLGFYDEYHFSKQFKKITGYAPKYYKNNILKISK